MADKKITDLTAKDNPTGADLLEIVDVADTSESAQGSSKKATLESLGASLGGAGRWELLGSVAASANSQINVDNVVSGDFDEYLITLTDVLPATDNVAAELILRSSSPANIGGTYKTGLIYTGVTAGGSSSSTDVSGTNGFRMEGSQGNGAGRTLMARIELNLSSNAGPKDVFMRWIVSNYLGGRYTSVAAGHNSDSTPVAGFGFAYTSGNVASGKMTVYGLRKP